MPDLRNVDLEALAEADGVRLRGAPGRERYGACPKCGGTDRFHIWPADGKRDRALFFCRTCYPEKKPGDAIDYLRHFHGLSYAQALARLGLRDDDTGQATKPARPRVLTDDTGLAIPDALEAPPAASWQSAARAFVARCEAALWAKEPTPAARAALAYLRDSRMLEGDTIRRYRLGWHEPPDISAKLEGGIYAARGIVIPRFFAGELWAVNVRRSKADIAEAKRRNAADDAKPASDTRRRHWPEGKLNFLAGSSPRQFFNGDALTDEHAAALLCAGEFDAMLAQQSAPPGVACVTPGGESYTPTFENVTMLRGRRVLIAFDADDTGTAGALRWKQHLPGATIAKPAEGKDLTDWARAMTPAILTVWLEDWLAAGQDETLAA